MNALDIRTAQQRAQFRPGEVLEGNVEWVLDRNIEALELRLCWYTSGKGDSDVSVEDSRRFEAPALSGSAPFRFTLPDAPYSFSGRLISLAWALEFVVIPGEDATRFEFVLSPTGEEVLLPQSQEADSIKKLPPWLQAKMQGKARQSQPEQSTLQQQNPFDN